jgi:hypothetical protein
MFVIGSEILNCLLTSLGLKGKDGFKGVRDLRMFVLGLLLFSGELGLYDS